MGCTGVDSSLVCDSEHAVPAVAVSCCSNACASKERRCARCMRCNCWCCAATDQAALAAESIKLQQEW
jgi:hypothetical protein